MSAAEHEWASNDEHRPVSLDDFNTYARNGDSEPAARQDEDTDGDSWEPINLADLDEQPPVQPTLGGVGLVYPGKRHVFSGPQESAKTLAAYAIGLEVVRQNHNLILIDFEMGRWDARNRLRELGATPLELARIGYIEPHEPATDTTMTQLLHHGPALVIIDAAAGAYDLQGLDDNKRQDVERFTRIYVRTFWRNNIATIVLDHVVKNTETRGKYAIGSERKIGGADVHLGFEVITPIQRGQTGLYKIVTHKDRGGFLQRGKLADLALTSATDTHQITWTFTAAEPLEEGEPWLPTHLMQKISSYLAALHEPVPRKNVLADITGRADYLRQAIDHLVRLGYATETVADRGVKLLEHTRLFHENDLPHNPESPGCPTASDGVPDGVVPPRPRASPPSRGTALDGDDVGTPSPPQDVPPKPAPKDPDHDIPF